MMQRFDKIEEIYPKILEIYENIQGFPEWQHRYSMKIRDFVTLSELETFKMSMRNELNATLEFNTDNLKK